MNPSSSGLRARAIVKSVRGMVTSDGAGVKLSRLIGTPILRNLDPFLMLDEFGSDEPQDYLAGFPDHPHRGFETITYMIAGRFRHRDNQGNEGLLQSGGAQWMTAGRGIIHSEMPEQERGLVRGFQLWLNLPNKDKMCAPSYRDLQPHDIPVAELPGGARAKVIAGRVGEVTGPVSGRATEPLYVDVELPANVSVDLVIPFGHEGFIYPYEEGVSILSGEPVMPRALAQGELGVFGKGDVLRVQSASKSGASARALVVAAKPIGEPIVQAGPFVMTTPADIRQAILDFQSGRF